MWRMDDPSVNIACNSKVIKNIKGWDFFMWEFFLYFFELALPDGDLRFFCQYFFELAVSEMSLDYTK